MQPTINRQRAAIASRRLTLKKKNNVPQTVRLSLHAIFIIVYRSLAFIVGIAADGREISWSC